MPDKARGARAIAHLAAFAVMVVVSAATGLHARAQENGSGERLQVGISKDFVRVSSDFAGQDIVVFGTIENADPAALASGQYSVAVAIRGPLETVVVRRKERIFGIWVNREARRYAGVPAFYSVASGKKLTDIASAPVLRQAQLGIDNISMNIISDKNAAFIMPSPEFSSSLRRIKKRAGLFSQDNQGVVFLGASLFRATMVLPSAVPIGKHEVTVYLFRNGQLISSNELGFEVGKVGFEKVMYTLAGTYGIWYGVLAVMIALATGWLASVIFGGNRR